MGKVWDCLSWIWGRQSSFRYYLTVPLALLFLMLWLKPEGDPPLLLPDLTAYPWVFSRQPAQLGEAEQASVIFVGDVLLGRGVDLAANPLGDVAGLLAAADLAVGNLEGVISARLPLHASDPDRQFPDQPIYLSMPATAVHALHHAGFDILSLANNHSLDEGVSGLDATATRLHREGLHAIGLTDHDPVIQEVNGIRLAFLAFNAIPTTSCQPVAGERQPSSCPIVWDAETAVRAVASAHEQADAVIVSIHWGFEYEPQADPTQERIAQALLAAGADLVVGHHPHVAQPVAVMNGGVVAYSLGNFVFDQSYDGLALRVVFDTAGLQGVQVLPVQAGVHPHLLSPEEGQSLLARVLPPPLRLGFACDETSCSVREMPQVVQSGQFYSEQIDLTGDGIAETVQREGERVVVYDGTKTAVWRSPDTWRVVDVALGDPNDDGRYEIMLAIWRQDGAGYERSQPYIVGYRHGQYDLLWGGRPVGDPIRELTLGDVDGDNIEELIVIEELADGSAQAISVWQWQGWTFGLQWRSDELPGTTNPSAIPGSHYQDLVFTSGIVSVAVAR